MLGRQISLRNGELNFTAWVDDTGDGDWVLLLHGFPDGPETWEHQVSALVASGYKTLVLTSRGYESGSCPENNDYQLISLADDVPAWLDVLDIQKGHFIGHDWGASIGYAVAARHPERLISLSCLAVPHPARLAEAIASQPAQLWRSRYIIGFQFQGLAEWRIRRNNFAWIERLWKRWSPSWQIPVNRVEAVKKRFQQPGVLEATLCYYRQGTDTKTDVGKASRALSQQAVTVPTLGLCGTEDACISADVFVSSMQASDFPGGLSVQCVPNAGHFLHLEQPKVVNDHLLKWLASDKRNVT